VGLASAYEQGSDRCGNTSRRSPAWPYHRAEGAGIRCRAALRTTIAAIDNAEAVAAPGANAPVTSARIAGAHPGVGSTEAVRRQLDGSQLRTILRDQIAEHTREADRYDALGQAEAAQRLRHQAGVLAEYLPPEDMNA
jgi:uncharacterized protein